MRERDALLATKLRVPRSHDVLVRPRLLERLEEAASRERARLLLAHGEVAEAAGWTRDLG